MGHFVGTHFQSDQNFSKQFSETTKIFFCKKANKHKHLLQLSKFQLINLNRT